MQLRSSASGLRDRRHETILQLVRSKDYYFDLYALKEHPDQTSNPGNVWNLHHARNKNGHTAPFSPDLARYAHWHQGR